MSSGHVMWDWEAKFEGDGVDNWRRLTGHMKTPANWTEQTVKNHLLKDAPKQEPRVRSMWITEFRAKKRPC